MLLLAFFLISFSIDAQLSCKTKTGTDGGTVKTCLHKNGKISTSESWNKDKRSGNIVAYNNKGAELFNHSLHHFGGHASVTIDYYSNGQVSKVYYSDAPDGGIQYYNSTTTFDETGNQTGFYETKYPDDLKWKVIEEPVKTDTSRTSATKVPVEPKKEEPKLEVVECAAIVPTHYKIENTTSSTVRLKITAVPNSTVLGESKEIVLKPLEKIVFDTLFMAGRPINETIYSVQIVSYTKSRKNKSIKFIESVPVDEPKGARVYSWFIVKD